MTVTGETNIKGTPLGSSPGDREEWEIFVRWINYGELPLTQEEQAEYRRQIDELMQHFKKRA